MKQILEILYNQIYLSQGAAKALMLDIMEGKYSDIQIAAFLSAYNMRFPSVEEILGFRHAMMEKCVHIDLSAYEPMDIVGTGGDGKNTFNISTLASFVASGAGVKVAKHGNRGVSSASGSSDVLGTLGVKFSNKEDLLKKQLEEAGICFLFAPFFHPSMKVVAPARAEMKVKTVFNLLGPLANPASVKKGLLGVYALPIARLYNEVLRTLKGNFSIIHSIDGYDEVSLTGAIKTFDKEGEKMLNPADFGMEKIEDISLYGGETAEDAAKIFMNILKGEGTKAQNEVVCANAALAISLFYSVSISEGVERAFESLNSGEALRRLQVLINLSQQ
jgi:anthranilate phosphoribosyltransferase